MHAFMLMNNNQFEMFHVSQIGKPSGLLCIGINF